jgi:hypothetical protein
MRKLILVLVCLTFPYLLHAEQSQTEEQSASVTPPVRIGSSQNDEPSSEPLCRKAILIVGLDDYSAIIGDDSFYDSFARACEARGFRSSFSIYTGKVTLAEWKKLHARVLRGHDIMAHSRTHPDLTNPHGISIRYQAAGAKTATVSTSHDQLTTIIDGNEDLKIDLRDPAAKRLWDLEMTVKSHGNYSCSNLNVNVGPRSFLLAHVMDCDINGRDCHIMLDQTRLNRWEMAGSKHDIETKIGGGYVCKTASYPGNDYDETTKEAFRTAGFLGARAGSAKNESYQLENVNIYQVYGASIIDFINKSRIKSDTLSLINWMRTVGAIVFLYGHDHRRNVNEFSIPDWEDVLDVVKESGIRVMTFSEAVEHIRNIRTGFLPPGVNVDENGEIWVRTIDPYPCEQQ